MDDGVFADLEVRQILQAHLLDHTAEIDVGHAGAVAFLDVEHSPRYRQAHGPLLTVGGSCPAAPGYVVSRLPLARPWYERPP